MPTLHCPNCRIGDDRLDASRHPYLFFYAPPILKEEDVEAAVLSPIRPMKVSCTYCGYKGDCHLGQVYLEPRRSDSYVVLALLPVGKKDIFGIGLDA